MRRNLSVLFLLVCGASYSSSSGMSIREYFPEVNRQIARVTWAHAVNSRSDVLSALEDSEIMMLEADILMGTLNNSTNSERIPIMAHPPKKTSDLTFAQFLDIVITGVKDEGKKKGLKLDFKEIEAVEPCLKLLKEKLEVPGAPSFPIIVNADVLKGPVNATKEPLDAPTFISLAKTHTPFAILSIGWTTRFGGDDAKALTGSTEGTENISVGEYSKDHTKQMINLFKKEVGGFEVFPHITFPVRAGIAAQSVDNLFNMLHSIRADCSLSIWSPKDDPVNIDDLNRLITFVGKEKTFIDLPFSLDGPGRGSFNKMHVDDEEKPKGDLNEGVDGSGRAPPEDQQESSKAPRTLSVTTILPVIAIGLITAFFIRRNF